MAMSYEGLCIFKILGVPLNKQKFSKHLFYTNI